MEVEVAEDRLWRSSSSKFNTGGPVLKELLLARRPMGGRGGGKPVCKDLQGGSERAKREGGVRAAAEHGTLQQAGTQWPHYHTGWQGLRYEEDKKNKNKTKKDDRDGDPPCWTQ